MLAPVIRRAALASITVALLLGGCGTSSSAPGTQDATLMLDFQPNAVHVGIYSALARTYDEGEGVKLHVLVPSASSDSIRLLEAGRVGFAILDIHDLSLAREQGKDIVGIMAIVQRPLASVIAAPGIKTPRELEGKLVGVTGVPSDTAVLRSILSGAGGNIRSAHTVTIGFNAVAALLSGKVQGATAFWNAEGITIQRRRRGFRVFRVDDYGAPSYPELVVCAKRSTLRSDPALARAVVRTLVRGYDTALSDPEGSEADFRARVRGTDPHLLAAEVNALEPAFLAPDGRFGELNRAALEQWSAWELRFGIVHRRPDARRAFDPSFLAGTASLSGS